MAITASGLFVPNFIDVLDATQLALDLSLTTHKIALYNNTHTPDYSGTGAYTAVNEVSGTGWAAGGVTLATAAAGGTSTTPTLTESPAGTMMYDMADVSVATTTLTNARGALIYADALVTPADPGIVFINFGADYSTNAGTFGIQWAAGGVFSVDLTP